MAQHGTGLAPSGRSKTRTWAGVLIGLLVLVALIDGGVGPAISILGLIALVVGAWGLLRGGASWAGIVTRRVAGGVAIAGLLVSGVGTALTPVADESAASAAPIPPASSSAAASSAASATTQRPQPLVASTPVPTTQAPPALPPAPTMLITCPGGGSNSSPVFGQQIAAAAPYSVTIDYGDGEVYTNNDQNLAAVFSHTYPLAGAFTVQAVLTDVAGQTTSGSCTYSWTAPVVVPAPVPDSGGGGAATGGSSQPGVGAGAGGGSSSAVGGGSSVSYQNCDAVRAAGAAPIYPGDPGFESKFDRDGDGVGCE